MVVRLILVGLVAGLGLSLPGRSDLDVLSRSASRWMNARLAEWDAGTSVEEGSFVLIREPVIPRYRCAVDPVVSDHDFDTVVDETVAAFVQDELASRVGAEERGLKEIAGVAPISNPASLAIAVPVEPADADLARMDLAFASVMEEQVEAFAADLAEQDHQQGLESLAFEGWASEMVRFMTTEAVVEIVAVPTKVSSAAYEPLEIGDDLYAGEAYALNRLSEGLPEQSTPAAEVSAPGESRLTQAVRLTREAVVAWASLLHGPAVMTIGR